MAAPAEKHIHPLARFDPGWLFLLPGAVIVAATVLIPAQDDLAIAQNRRDQAEAVLDQRVERLRNYSKYLDAVDAGDQAVVLDLAAKQLNLAPEGKQAIFTPDELAQEESASVFPTLEPAPPKHVGLHLRDTLLRRLTTNDHTRLWLVAGGMVCILFGLLPPSSGTRAAAQG